MDGMGWDGSATGTESMNLDLFESFIIELQPFFNLYKVSEKK